MGFNIGGSIGINFDNILGARADIQYNSFPYKENSLLNVTGDPYKVITLSVDFVVSDFKNISKPEKIIPFAYGGLGLFYLQPGDIKISGNKLEFDSETKLGLVLGGGAIYKFNENLGISAEFKYSFTLGGDQLNYIPLRVGLTFTP